MDSNLGEAAFAVPDGGWLPADTRIYAIGDVHGRADLLKSVVSRLVQDLADHPVRMPMIVFVGDYLDRGPDSAGVIDIILALRRRVATVCLCGNHELYALRFLQTPATGQAWFELGGRQTLTSYGVSPPWQLDPAGLEAASQAFAEALPDEHFYFLTTLGLTFSLGGYLFAHGGIAPDRPVAEQNQSIVTMIRDSGPDPLSEKGVVLVHGHTPTKAVVLDRNRLNIDTGAYATGRLSCLVIEEDRLRLL